MILSSLAKPGRWRVGAFALRAIAPYPRRKEAEPTVMSPIYCQTPRRLDLIGFSPGESRGCCPAGSGETKRTLQTCFDGPRARCTPDGGSPWKPKTEEGKGSWLKSLPGILTTIAAILTAFDRPRSGSWQPAHLQQLLPCPSEPQRTALPNCIQPYVLRKAYQEDYVCVTRETHARELQDNEMAGCTTGARWWSVWSRYLRDWLCLARRFRR